MRRLAVLTAFLRGTAGQNSVEYAILVAAIVMTLLLVIGGFTSALSMYHQDVTSVVCLPVP